MPIRIQYTPVVSAVEGAGFHVTEMELDSGGDRIVCVGMRRPGGGYTGNSFWLAERNDRWFLGTWGGLLYRVADVNRAVELALAWLRQNRGECVSDVPEELKLQFDLVPAEDEEFDAA